MSTQERRTAGATDKEPRKHRISCATNLVWETQDGEMVSCGLKCDCDNPGPWVVVSLPSLVDDEDEQEPSR